MFGGSKFLTDFINRQSTLIELEAGNPNKKQTGKKPKHGTANGEDPFPGDPFARICSEKPGRKEIVEYFRNRIGELVAEDVKNF
jgi:hypothetical protein